MGKLMFNPAADSLPSVNSQDNGKVLQVAEGEWTPSDSLVNDLNELNSKLDILNNIHINTDLPSAYTVGCTIERCGSAQGFPYNYASVITFRNNANYTAQLLIQSTGHMCFRASPGDDVWGAWVTIA